MQFLCPGPGAMSPVRSKHSNDFFDIFTNGRLELLIPPPEAFWELAHRFFGPAEHVFKIGDRVRFHR